MNILSENGYTTICDVCGNQKFIPWGRKNPFKCKNFGLRYGGSDKWYHFCSSRCENYYWSTRHERNLQKAYVTSPYHEKDAFQYYNRYNR